MNHSLIIYKQLSDSLSKDFNMEENQLKETEDAAIVIKTKLTKIINHLLDKDMNKLMAILYRIDIAESKVTKILAESPVENIAGQIADLIIERQIQKILSRIKYK